MRKWDPHKKSIIPFRDIPTNVEKASFFFGSTIFTAIPFDLTQLTGPTKHLSFQTLNDKIGK